LFTH
jgi:hypothetical protein